MTEAAAAVEHPRTVPFPLDGLHVWVAGGTGLVGSAVVRRLGRLPVGRVTSTSSSDVDLTDQAATHGFVERLRPDVLVLAAARVGGVAANVAEPGSFLHENLMIGANALEAARRVGVRRTVVIASSAIYPAAAPQPLQEGSLFHGPLESSHEGFSTAMLATVQLAKMYRRQHGMDVISLLPSNLYGPGGNFDLERGHVLPSLIRKLHAAKVGGQSEVELWGTGTPRREFLHVDDMADAVLHAVRHYDSEMPLNVGVGTDIAIIELAELIAEVVGWEGRFLLDTSRPDGAPKKLLDTSRLRSLGWQPSVTLRDGLAATYGWFVQHADAG